MTFRATTGNIRFALLAALGTTACSGSTTNSGSRPLEGDASAGRKSSGGQSSGGAAVGGASSGGQSSGGAAVGGASTGGGGTSTGGSPVGGGGAGGYVTGCANPKPFSSMGSGVGPSGGFVQCDNGIVHRPVAGACWNHIETGDAEAPLPNPSDAATFACRKNADCTDAPYAHCSGVFTGSNGGAPSYACHYGCVQDSDCDSGMICLCSEPVGQCVPATCKSDQDCADGNVCRQWYIRRGCAGDPQFSCTPLCTTDSDCPEPGMRCTQGNCEPGFVCGRPFLVHGAARRAGAERRDDWGSAVRPDVSGLSQWEQRALANHYAEIALMEHASIAAFARFSLELLSLGAPPELIAESTAALADETRHARICFGLAAAYGGTAVGPGPLPLEGVLAASSLRDSVKTAFLEACIGETIAAVEVAEAASHTRDPAVRALLAGIAEDETRHAALGFRFVRWALEGLESGPRRALAAELFELLEQELETATRLSAIAAPCAAEGDDALAGHGVLDDGVRSALRCVALREAVMPCVRALLEGSTKLAA